MPGAIIGAALAAAGSFAAGATVLGLSVAASAAVVGFASLALGGLSYALTPRIKAPSFNNNVQSATLTVRQSDLTRQHVYGHTRITRGYAHMAVTGVNNKLHIFVMLCEGELRSINEIWMDDYSIPSDWINEDGLVVIGRYAGKLTIRKHLGSPTQEADPVAISNLSEWTTAHRLQGIAYLYMILEKDQDVYPNGVPNISAIVEGPSRYDPRVDANRWSTNIALYASDFILDTRYGFGASEDDIDFTNTAAQANICDEIVDTEPEAVALVSVDTGTDFITLSGDLLKLQYGDRVQVTSTGTLPGGISALTDYYVIPYQVKTTPRILLATSLDNAMAKTNINITSAGTGTITVTKNGEPRYHGAGIVDVEANLSETLNDMVNSMAGRAVNIGGFWTLLAGAWRTPSVTYTIGDMRSAMGMKNALSMSQSYNVVKGLFISPLNSYQSSDYPSARYTQFIDQDNGQESIKELNLPFTDRPTTAQRIAKIELFRGRQDISFSNDFSMKAIQNQPGDNIYLDIDRLGWEQKPFEITELSFNITPQGLTCNFNLRETAEEIFDWDSGEAIGYDPAPNTNMPNPFLVLAPTGVAYSSRPTSTVNGDTVYTLTLQWDQHPDNFVTQFGDFELQFKLSSESLWRPSFFVDGILTQSDLLNSSVNIPYDLRIRARNNLGVRSAWVTILGAVVGSSGGVTDTEDWRFVNEAVTIYNDWGNVYDAPSVTNDWGFVV